MCELNLWNPTERLILAKLFGPILHPQHGLDEIRASEGFVHLSRGLGSN